ncbi:MAG TPA: hypothetical protein VG960_00330 [Caulobacteraceae bacterium]|nr:hypothetical protein [Caulobacteraceae bacterium]
MSDSDVAIISAPPPPLSAAELPEVQWLWRRWFTYVLTVLLCLIVAQVIRTLPDRQLTPAAASALEHLGLSALALIALLILFYLGGATLTDLQRLVALARDRIALRANNGAPT